MGPLKRKGILTLDEVTAKAERQPLVAKLAGVVSGLQIRKSARGNRFAFCQMSDTTGAFEVTLFSESLEKRAGPPRNRRKGDCHGRGDHGKRSAQIAGPISRAHRHSRGRCGGMGLRIFVEHQTRGVSVATRCSKGRRKRPRGLGADPSTVCLMDDSLPGEVEMDLGTRIPDHAADQGGDQILSGVLDVRGDVGALPPGRWT